MVGWGWGYSSRKRQLAVKASPVSNEQYLPSNLSSAMQHDGDLKKIRQHDQTEIRQCSWYKPVSKNSTVTSPPIVHDVESLTWSKLLLYFGQTHLASESPFFKSSFQVAKSMYIRRYSWVSWGWTADFCRNKIPPSVVISQLTSVAFPALVKKDVPAKTLRRAGNILLLR